MIPFWNLQSQYGTYRTNTFTEIFANKDAFRTEYTNIGLGGFSKDETINNLYALLYARHGNDHIFNSDPTQFKYQLFAIVFNYGAKFEKQLEIQHKMINLSDADLERGTTTISNYAENPSTLPNTQEFEQLKKINSQNAAGVKLSKLNALALQNDALDTKFIDEFLQRFDKLFNPFPAEYPLTYVIDNSEE